ncbi:MAG: type II toxin-antitoxin system RelE/ParE family toxin [Alphaproteobacteria bacterium]|nr:type II toxin-antitoxin system RelE/ParE family toxin [Alphaproteobacteria bacterium]
MAHVLATSAALWGSDGRRRYAALLAAAMRKAAADPRGPATRDCGELRPGIRSLHLRHARAEVSEPAVNRPVHIVYYRPVAAGVVEIVRVLHERMEPGRHLRGGSGRPHASDQLNES